MNTAVTETTAFKAMQTDIQVSMDDVVSAFVSQYENNLYARKKELTSDIRASEEELRGIDTAVLTKITGASFKTSLPFGLAMTVGKGSINWGDSTVDFQIEIKKAGDARYGSTITIHENKSIPAIQVKANKKVKNTLDSLRSDLGEVLVSLKSITRKERQVRGRIAIRKLEDSGYANLMQDAELVQLVQLDD